MRVRREEPPDVQPIRAINIAAFGAPVEADIVDTLRAEGAHYVSLVAENDGEIVGHIIFSPARVAGAPDLRAVALAPMAVSPDHQRGGIGSALVRAGLDECRRSGVDAVFVVGYPSYYPRFGFSPASGFGFKAEFDVPDDVFMAVELSPGALAGRSGTVYFHESFRSA